MNLPDGQFMFPKALNDWQQQIGDSIRALDEMTPDRHDRKTYERLFPGKRPPTGTIPGQQAGATELIDRNDTKID